MTTLVRGTYRDGVLHLHEPLELPDNTEVDISVNPIEKQDKVQSERERIYAILIEEGLMKPRSQLPSSQPPLTPEEEAELAKKLAKAGSLSELIIQEREEQDDRLL
jgi:hypothetical protein